MREGDERFCRGFRNWFYNVSPSLHTSFRPLAVTFGISYRLIKHKERRTDILFEGFVHCHPQRPR